MAKIYKYLRFSTEKQSEDQQELTIDKWLTSRNIKANYRIVDCVSGGVSYENRKLKEILSKVEKGDTIIVSEFSRLSRSMGDFNKMLHNELKPKGINIIICSMGMELRCSELKAIDEMLLSFWGFAAQAEKELIQDRTKSGMGVTMAKGTKIGRANPLYGNNPNDTRTSEERAFDKERGILMQKINKNKSAISDMKKQALIRLYRQVVAELKSASTESVEYWENWTRKTAVITIDHHKAVARLINEDSAAEGVFTDKINYLQLASWWNSLILSISRSKEYKGELEQFNKNYEQFKNL